MGQAGGGHLRFHWSTAHWPKRDRVGMWREVFGRQFLRVDVEPIPGVPFHADLKGHVVDGVGLVQASFCGTRERRTRELLADGNDSIGLAINLFGPFSASVRGHEFMLAEGDAIAMSCADPSTFVRPAPGSVIGVTLPRPFLAQFIPNLDDAVPRRIPKDSDALQLLQGYLRTIAQLAPAESSPLWGAITAHVCDLVALVLGPPEDAAKMAAARGGRAAQLEVIKSDIARNFASAGLTIEAVARRHKMTARSIQRLFEASGVTFSEHLRDLRLAQAYRMLTDPRFAAWTISAIADECGLTDRSHFNRAIRARYGAAPSDIRAGARDHGAADENPRAAPDESVASQHHRSARIRFRRA